MPKDPNEDVLPAETLRWLEVELGAEVLGVERFPRGRQAWWLDLRTADGQVARWMLKGRRAPASVIARSRLLSDFGPAREAAAMRAVAATGVPVPRVGGFDAVSGSLLVQQIPGSALLQRLPLDERRAVIRDYARQLGALHATPPSQLAIDPVIPEPADSAEMVLSGWLRSAQADALTARDRLRHPEPLLDLLVGWLHAHRPPGRGLAQLRLLHGDAGVNNFLFAGGRITALIDWELSFLGDPMSDLGNARYREALYPTDTFADLVAEYEAATGQPVDHYAISYYTALASVVLSLGMLANVHHPRAGQPEVVARIWQDALARCVACEAVAEAEGICLDYDERPLVARSSFAPFAELLAERAERQIGRTEGDTAAEVGYACLARSAVLMLNWGTEVDDRLVADTAGLLGRKPESIDAARAGLSDRLADDWQGVLVVLARDARRRLELLRPLQSAEMWEDGRPVVAPTERPADGFVLPGYSLTKQ